MRKLPSGKWQGWYFDTGGRRCYFTSDTTKAETKAMAARLEDDHRQVRLGYREAPKSASRHRARLSSETIAEYIAWGESQGGRGGRPWGPTHARNRRSHLDWWTKRLGLETLADLDGCLPQAEKALRDLQSGGRSGKTLANRAESLRALCRWCVERGLLAENPLEALAPFDITPQTQRRAITADEIRRLLGACAPHRRLTLETAFMSGLRAGELKHLTVDDLDTVRGGLVLHAEWTKNRRPGFQPLPSDLTQRLASFAGTGEARALYERFHTRSGTEPDAPCNPLLYVPTHPSRDLQNDLEAAGIPKWTPAGKIDFHAARVAYITLVIEAGSSVKESQHLARHVTPDLTLNIYGRARDERLQEVVQRVGTELQEEPACARGVHEARKIAIAGGTEMAQPPASQEVAPSAELVEAAGIEPASENDSSESTTCVVSHLISPPSAPTDRIRRQPVQKVSPGALGQRRWTSLP